MKKLLLLILLLIFSAISASAWNPCVVTSGKKATAGDECSGKLICQNFEGTGYDNSESWIEAGSTPPDEDYTGDILRGSQSCLVHDYGTYAITYFSFGSSQSVLHGHFLFEIHDNLAGDNICLKLRDSAANTYFLIYFRSVGSVWRIQHGTVTADSTSTWALNTTYHIWFDYTTGTGNNGTAHLYVSETTTKPAADITITTGDSTTDIDRLYLQAGEAQETVFDQVLVDTSDIGDVQS